MRRLILMAMLAVALAATAWFIWALVIERAVAGWLQEREDEGWVVATEGIRVTGFPSTFDTVIGGIDLADPATGLAWSAPSLILAHGALSPGRVEMIWPEEQIFASPFESVTVFAGDMRSVLELQPVRNFALDASETSMSDLRLQSSRGWEMALERGQIDMVRQEGTEATYRIHFEAAALTPPDDIAQLLDPAGLLPPAIPLVRSEAVIRFDRQWDLSAIEVSRPQPVRIDLAEARAEWGELMFRSTGALDIDTLGRATGDIALRAENWEDMLNMATRAGLIGEGLASTARTALGFLAGLSGEPENLEATLRFEDGFVFFGPLPIGEAPLIRLR